MWFNKNAFKRLNINIQKKSSKSFIVDDEKNLSKQTNQHSIKN